MILTDNVVMTALLIITAVGLIGAIILAWEKGNERKGVSRTDQDK